MEFGEDKKSVVDYPSSINYDANYGFIKPFERTAKEKEIQKETAPKI